MAIISSVDPVQVKCGAHSSVLHYLNAGRLGGLTSDRRARVLYGCGVAFVFAPVAYSISIACHPDWSQPVCYAAGVAGGAFFAQLHKWVCRIGDNWTEALSGKLKRGSDGNTQ